MKPLSICSVCGTTHYQKGDICARCRHTASKVKCPIDGCNELINSNASTCLKHRHLQQKLTYNNCRECGIGLVKSTRVGLCPTCHEETRILCACGCGQYRRKYDKGGRVREFISGHNDNGIKRDHRECLVCRKQFKPRYRRSKLCSIECRTEWLTINPPLERKQVLVECAVCGKPLYRALHQVGKGKDFACSKECQYKLVANKLSGARSQPKRLAAQRDNFRCSICGFDTIIEVHHIHPKKHGGDNSLDNLITLCPNHHTMADRGLISQDELRAILSRKQSGKKNTA